jgi:hypothetical protein
MKSSANFCNTVKIKNKPNAAGAGVKAVMFVEQKDGAKILEDLSL